MAAERLNARTGQDWFIDSGATDSFTDQRHIMTNFVPIVPGTLLVDGIGGVKLEVHGRGDVPVISEVLLKQNKLHPFSQ